MLKPVKDMADLIASKLTQSELDTFYSFLEMASESTMTLFREQLRLSKVRPYATGGFITPEQFRRIWNIPAPPTKDKDEED